MLSARQSYITTVMFKTQATDKGYATNQHQADEATLGNCQPLNFDFDRCFNNQLYDYNCELQN